MSTPLTATCPGCLKSRAVPEDLRGVSVRCKTCDTHFVVGGTARTSRILTAVAALAIVAVGAVTVIALSADRKPAVADEEVQVAAAPPAAPPAPAVAPAPRPALAPTPTPAPAPAPVAAPVQAQAPTPAPAPRLSDRSAVTEQVKNSVALVSGKFGHGSGFLVAPNVLATNSHVVMIDMLDDVTVRFSTNGLLEPNAVKVKLLYEDKARDLALLWLDTPQSRPVIPFADGFDPSTTTDPAVSAVGNPGQAVAGVALSNSVEPATVLKDSVTIHGQTYYELDYATGPTIRIGPGISGGPVVNRGGEFIGVVTMVKLNAAGQLAGRAYCIPASHVKKALDDLGPATGWDAKSRAATGEHALDIAMVGQYVNVAFAGAMVKLRSELVAPPKFGLKTGREMGSGPGYALPAQPAPPEGFELNFHGIVGRNKELTKDYRVVDKPLTENTAPALQMAKNHPDLAQAQRARLLEIRDELTKVRKPASSTGYTFYEGQMALGCVTRATATFEAFRKDSRTPAEVLLKMQVSMLRAAGVNVADSK